MKVREQITVTGDFPISSWGDRGLRGDAWTRLRGEADGIAAQSGNAIPSQIGDKSVLYMRVTGEEDGARPAECSIAEAEFVRLRLSVWAEPA